MAADWDHARQQLLGLLDETWRGGRANGLPEGHTYYSYDDQGLEQSLAGLDAARALQPVGATCIAQQAQHIAFGARVFAAWLAGGDARDNDWEGSWRLPAPLAAAADAAVDDRIGLEAAWAALQADLWEALAELRQAIADHALDSNRRLTQAHGAVAHAVYHLGAIRSKLTAV
jgi:hypothetical protein